MADKRLALDPEKHAGAIITGVRNLRLVWCLFWDKRIPRMNKLLVVGALAYVISPVDFIPDVIPGLGQIDDIGIVLVAFTLFIESCPKAIVDEHRKAIWGEVEDDPDSEVLTGEFHEIKD